MKRKTVCIDVDGVLADYRHGWRGIDCIGDPIPGAQEFVKTVRGFADVVIWTTRCNPEVNGRSGMGASLLKRIVENWLGLHGFVYDDVFIGPSKPICAAFVDDRAVSCRPQSVEEWNENMGERDRARLAYDSAVMAAGRLCGIYTQPMDSEMIKSFMVSGANNLLYKARSAIVNQDWRGAVQALREAAEAVETCCMAIEKEVPMATTDAALDAATDAANPDLKP